MTMSINAIKCPYCGAKKYHENNDFSETNAGEKMFCLWCEERFVISKTYKIFNYYLISTRTMKKFYFTFGQRHVHSLNGKTFDKDIVVEIQSETSGEARKKMVSFFGDKWFTHYEEKPDMRYFPRGIVKI